MVKVNRCTGEVEYANGCTSSGYLCSVTTVVALIVGVPMVYIISKSASSDDFKGCLAPAKIDRDEETKDLSNYYRYEVQMKTECNFEERMLRACKENETSVVSFERHPPGPLRSKKNKDIKESFDYIGDTFEADGVLTCDKTGAAFKSTFNHFAAEPLNTSLATTAPFSAIFAKDEKINYNDFACMHAIDWALDKVEEALKNNKVAQVDYTSFLKKFWELKIPHRCYIDTSIYACPGEKDTKVGHKKGSDLGYGMCDFVEYLNMA